MDWQNQLITLYLKVCKHYQTGLWSCVQRFSSYSDLNFSDEEVITLYLFGIIEKKRELKSIYEHAKHYWREWFPHLPSYVAYVQRLNRLAAVFPALAEAFCPTQAPATFARAIALCCFFPEDQF